VLGNALSHLIEAGLMVVTPWLVIAIGAVYPATLWAMVHLVLVLRAEHSASVAGPVAVVTSAYLTSPWCAAEVGIARSQGSQLLPLGAEPGMAHPLLTSVQHADYTADPIAPVPK
jgi:hypothetical protein